ncbi:MAG: flagellar basal body L-ring protein FlgH [Methylophaga sp.]|jgi:flagellar L-ring protein precursor FlgH|nr:flagellar basal body L-ring protein FlgH [Methylophaga sp.]
MRYQGFFVPDNAAKISQIKARFWHGLCKLNSIDTFVPEIHMKFIYRLLGIISLILLSACVSNEVKRDPAYAAVRPVATAPVERNDGAIFDTRSNITLYEDYKARRVGDILTVRLQERTDAEKEATTTVDKTSSNNINNPTIFGTTPQFSLPSGLPLANTDDNNLAFSTGANSSFEGEGESEQNNFLTGDISVSVVEVLSNGNMIVRGEKVVTINQGNEYVRLTGMISPRDIDATNTISSIRIADAQITYVGDGPANDSNAMGWLSRFFISALMPF